MSHPDPEHNPHAGAFPGLSVDDSGNVHTGYDDDGNPVTVTITPSDVLPSTREAVAAEGDDGETNDEGGERTSASSPTEPVGPEPSTSSGTSEKSAPSGETVSPRPVPTTEPPSSPDQTTKSTARSADGAGTEQPTTPSPRSGEAS